MKPYKRFWFTAALSTLLVTTILSLIAYICWQQIEPELKEILSKILEKNSFYFFFTIGLLLVVWGLWLKGVYNLYILPATKIADEILVIQSVNPYHRIKIDAGKEIEELAARINEVADRYQSLKKNIDNKIKVAHEELEQEKNILASIISSLSEGIIVCNQSGTILLFNKKAEEFFGILPGKELPNKKIERCCTIESMCNTKSKLKTTLINSEEKRLKRQFIGLGRDISSVINREQIDHAIEEINEKLSKSLQRSGTCFAVLGPNGHFLKVEIVPILSAISELAGFILTITNITQSYCNLSFTPTHIQTLLQRVKIAASEQYAISINLNMPEYPAWIYADKSYLVSAMLSLWERLGELTENSEFECYATIERDYLEIDIIWIGEPVSNKILDSWSQIKVPTEQNSIERYLTINDIFLHHEAEWWSSVVHKTPEKASLRIFFPSADSSKLIDILPITLTESRPEFYDFELLNRAKLNPAIQEELLSNITYTVLDTETTGLDPLTDEIISIAAVRIVNGKLLKNEIFNTFINPKIAIPDESIKIHGIRPEMVEGQPTIEKILPLFHQFAENTVLVGHNVAFDMKMFQVKEDISKTQFTQPVLDTMFLSAVIHPSHRYHNLEAIADRLGITISGRHTALGDALAAAEIFLKSIPLLARNGILTLNDAIEASKKTKYAKISY